jgi:hypothetical protein
VGSGKGTLAVADCLFKIALAGCYDPEGDTRLGKPLAQRDPPENGGLAALALRRRPSSIQAGIASGSAPARRHSCAAQWANRSSSSPSDDPGDLGEQVSPAACERAELGHRGSLVVAAKFAPPGTMPRLPRQFRYQDPVSLRTIIDHTFEYRNNPPGCHDETLTT